ncbi:hypothetical protein CW310_27025 [Pseudomonas citronellolis]|nr:hypothetical protein CW310_27025 [Pseudomonas citronellolis]
MVPLRISVSRLLAFGFWLSAFGFRLSAFGFRLSAFRRSELAREPASHHTFPSSFPRTREPRDSGSPRSRE